MAAIRMHALPEGLRIVLDGVHLRRASLVIGQDGEAVAAMEPVAGAATSSCPAKDLRGVVRPDAAFAADLEEVQRNQREVPTDVWPN